MIFWSWAGEMTAFQDEANRSAEPIEYIQRGKILRVIHPKAGQTKSESGDTMEITNPATRFPMKHTAPDHIGFSRRQIYRLVERGYISAVRKGRRLFFRKSELDRAFRACAELGVVQ